MTTAMGPPPPRNPTLGSNPETEPNSKIEDSTSSMKAPMAPPPPKNPNPPNPGEAQEQDQKPVEENPGEAQEQDQKAVEEKREGLDADSVEAKGQPTNFQAVKQSSVPYSIPDWGGPPSHNFYLEVLKDGSIIDQFEVCKKGAYMFGRADICDFVLEHPTISRFHAVLQFQRSGSAYLYDLGSTHGSFVNKNQVDKRVYVDLHVGDVLRFGCSTRLYVFQGPTELMPPEKDLKVIREARLREALSDRQASLARARREASLADGISWGLDEDAVEENEDDMDEVTWQTYKGQLTEKQQKTREKVVKRMEKIAHMKKEIAAIRAKDISQGGLTQGQQTQIARNEQRIAQLMEELENLEETLNESIRESLGARTGKLSRGKTKGTGEDDEEFSSDEDEFYDRTKKKASTQKGGEAPTVETADTLLDKRDSILKEIEEKEELLLAEQNKITSETLADTEPGDSLDAYMSGLSSQLVHDKTAELQNELSGLQSELDRVMYLLKIADPTGDAAKKRVLNLQKPKSVGPKMPSVALKKQAHAEPKKNVASKVPADVSEHKELSGDAATDASVQLTNKHRAEEMASETSEGKTVIYTEVKPQWLGAVEDTESKKTKTKTETLDTNDPDEFVDYKDRNKILANTSDSAIENAAPGLIIRKRKQEDKLKPGEGENTNQPSSSSKGAEIAAEDAVALLLKHSRGLQEQDEDSLHESPEVARGNKSKRDRKSKKKAKRVLGPEKPSYVDNFTDDEPWMPPEGQSGDGRTSLNDRYGY